MPTCSLFGCVCASELTFHSQTCFSRKVTWNSIYPHKFERKRNPPLLSLKQKNTEGSDQFFSENAGDSLVCSQLRVLIAVVAVLNKSQTKLSVPISLKDHTLKQRLLTRAEEPHRGNKHQGIYICASQPMQQKQDLGKASCWLGGA